MTDKEKYETLVAELKRLNDETAIGLNEWENGVENGRMEVINALNEKISSMQKEPVSDSETVETQNKEVYMKPHSEPIYLGIGGIPIDAPKYLCKEEPVSEDLSEASKEWLRPQLDKSYANYGEKKMMELTHFDGYAMLDAIEFGAKLQKQQMMAKAFDFTKEHDTACVLASECLRNHGWFNRERDFNDLWRHLSCVDELFVGKFSGKTKVIVIKED